MNNITLNSIIETLVPATDNHVVVIDNICLTSSSLTVELLHADNEGTIENETITITSEGTITAEGKFQTASDLSVLPLEIREVLAFFVVALRDGEVHGDNPAFELIAANKQFFLDREDAFVAAGVLCDAGIFDEHNMETAMPPVPDEIKIVID